MINIGIIGYGYWGPNLARNFAELQPRARLLSIADMREERRQIAQNRYPDCLVVSDYRDLLRNPEIDAVLIATPVSTHFQIAVEVLQANKHVFVEKPITSTVADAKQLIAFAQQQGRVLLVDHPFIYTGAVRKIKEIMSSGLLGDILYVDSVRINLGLFQSDVNVVHDLAVHDVSIISYLLDRDPLLVRAVGACHTGTGLENIAYITLDFGDNLLANIHVNWLSPVKVRTMLIGGSKNMILYNDVEPSEKIKVYDRGISLKSTGDLAHSYTVLTEYRVGDMYAPKLDQTEALLIEARHFLDCIEKGETPRSGGKESLRVIRVLEAASHSLKSGVAVALTDI